MESHGAVRSRSRCFTSQATTKRRRACWLGGGAEIGGGGERISQHDYSKAEAAAAATQKWAGQPHKWHRAATRTAQMLAVRHGASRDGAGHSQQNIRNDNDDHQRRLAKEKRD